MRTPRALLLGWGLLVVGGWAATLWLGEPSATAGPGPAPASVPPRENPAPGPQPEGGCESPAPAPSGSAGPLLSVKVPGESHFDGRMVQRSCVTVIARDGARAR
ncbi:hypothetical protein [Streptomyces sp. NPDC048590]|uniref:hypothetical protein n=1 Tax=Streptomyces sp. NPDC048590 TaxID=3365574 RepID=UPI003712EB66